MQKKTLLDHNLWYNNNKIFALLHFRAGGITVMK